MYLGLAVALATWYNYYWSRTSWYQCSYLWKKQRKKDSDVGKESGWRFDWNCLNSYALYCNHERRIW